VAFGVVKPTLEVDNRRAQLRATQGNVMAFPMPENPDDLPAAVWKAMNLSREQYTGIRAYMIERDRRTPAVGDPAPDFEIERLSPEGKRTGKTFRLSETRGRPVALVFGSYT
jgi:hypothetical protein